MPSADKQSVMTEPTGTWKIGNTLPCRRPARRMKVPVVAGPRMGEVGWIHCCAKHEKQFYAEQEENECLN